MKYLLKPFTTNELANFGRYTWCLGAFVLFNQGDKMFWLLSIIIGWFLIGLGNYFMEEES